MELGFSILNNSANGMALKIVVLFSMIIISMIVVGLILKVLRVPGKIINFVITAVGLGIGLYWLNVLQ